MYSHEEGVGKPDSRFYAIACQRLGVAPEETVFVDDTPACVDGALAAGMPAVRFFDSVQAIAELTRLLGGGAATGRNARTRENTRRSPPRPG